MYEDQPNWCVYDHAKKAFIRRTPLGQQRPRSVGSITNLTREQMAGYFDPPLRRVERHRLDCRQLRLGRLRETAEKHCGHWSTGQAPARRVFPPKQNPRIESMKKESVNQEHVLVISPAPAARISLVTDPNAWRDRAADSSGAGSTG